MRRGHRVEDNQPGVYAVGGWHPVTRTRELHPVLWPFEVTGRLEAVIRGWLVRHRGSWYR